MVKKDFKYGTLYYVMIKLKIKYDDIFSANKLWKFDIVSLKSSAQQQILKPPREYVFQSQNQGFLNSHPKHVPDSWRSNCVFPKIKFLYISILSTMASKIIQHSVYIQKYWNSRPRNPRSPVETLFEIKK